MMKNDKPFRLNQPLTLTDELGKGGEATVYNIAERPNQVAKIYHRPTLARAAKLRAMVANPPEQPANHIAIAWPTALLYQQNGQFYSDNSLDELEAATTKTVVGFLMPKITGGQAIFHIYNPVLRAQLPYPFSWQALHRTAYNLCAVVAKIHAKGYVIGDINESNILVNRQALVTLVDCDSFQVTDETGQIHRCAVGKPEYTPPELHGVTLREVDQTTEHDLFGLGVLLFQLLMEGYHPFAGVLQSKISVGRVDLHAIREGLYPYHNSSIISPPPAAPSIKHLHTWVYQSFNRCFEVGYQTPNQRPTARQWQQVFGKIEPLLQVCSVNKHHYYFPHLNHCPWCHQKPAKVQPSNNKKPKPRINMEIQLQAGIEAVKRNDISLAFKLFNQVIERSDDPTKGYIERLKLYYRLKQYHKVLDDCHRILALHPDQVEAHWYIAMAQLEKTPPQQTASKPQPIVQPKPNIISPHNTPLLGLQIPTFLQLRDRYTRSLNVTSLPEPNTVSWFLQSGIEALIRNEFSLALKQFNQVIQQSHDPIEGYLYRLKLYYRLRQYDKVLDDCQHVLTLHPDQAEAHFYRGAVYYEQNNYSSAQTAFTQAIDAGYHFIEYAYYNRAITHYANKNLSYTLADFKQYLTYVDDPYINSFVQQPDKLFSEHPFSLTRVAILKSSAKRRSTTRVITPSKADTLSIPTRFEIEMNTSDELHIRYMRNKKVTNVISGLLFIIALIFQYSNGMVSFPLWFLKFSASGFLGVLTYLAFKRWFHYTNIDLTDQYLTIIHRPFMHVFTLFVTNIEGFTIGTNDANHKDYRVIALLKGDQKQVVMSRISQDEAQFLISQFNKFLKLS